MCLYWYWNRTGDGNAERFELSILFRGNNMCKVLAGDTQPGIKN